VGGQNGVDELRQHRLFLSPMKKKKKKRRKRREKVPSVRSPSLATALRVTGASQPQPMKRQIKKKRGKRKRNRGGKKGCSSAESPPAFSLFCQKKKRGGKGKERERRGEKEPGEKGRYSKMRRVENLISRGKKKKKKEKKREGKKKRHHMGIHDVSRVLIGVSPKGGGKGESTWTFTKLSLFVYPLLLDEKRGEKKKKKKRKKGKRRQPTWPFVHPLNHGVFPPAKKRREKKGREGKGRGEANTR